MKWLNRNIDSKLSEAEKGDMTSRSLLQTPLSNGSSIDLDSDSDYEHDIAYVPEKKHAFPYYLRLLARGLLITLAFWGTLSVGKIVFEKLRSHKPVSCSCGGTTVAEAKSRGCVFSPLALSWLPPQCLDKELSDDFDLQGPLPGGAWPYWADHNATIPITREQMGELADIPEKKGVFYTTQGWHVTHCMYTWRKHYRARFNNVALEWRNDGIDHIEHCTGIVSDRAPLDQIWTMAGVELNADLG